MTSGDTAPALRGGASGGTAPALRGGASSGAAPALRGGASGGTAPALRGGASLRTSAAAAGLLACCAFAVIACGRGCGEQPARVLATLVEVQGTTVQRDFGAAPERWQHAQVGASFALGDGVRTDPPAHALLELADGSKLQMEPGTLVRFLAEGVEDGEQPLAIETGEALLIAGATDLQLHTQVGMAILQSGSRVRLSGGGRELGYRVEVGSLRFKDASGSGVVLHAGEDIRVGIGMAVLKRAASAAKPAEPEAKVQAAAEPPAQAAADAPVQAGVEGSGVRARARGSNAWDALDAGQHTLLVGTALRLPAGTSVHLARGEDRADLRGAGEFVIGSGAAWIETHSGGVHVAAGAQDIEIVVPGGLIIARAGEGGSEADVRIGDGSGLLSVQRGHVTLSGADGSRELGAGDERRFALTDAAEGVVEPGPDYANLVVRAGDSFTIHAAEVPVAVGFEVGSRCPHDASIELTGPGSKQRSRGTGRLNLLFQAGSRGYALRCVSTGAASVGTVVARGSVSVLRDAGTRNLPPRAPASSIDCDGRSYTIYYQNQLPDISARWPNAPSAARYTLEVDGKAMALDKPEHQFKSGSLREGTHRLNFQANERRARTTTVEISFDNAAPKASLAAPDDRSFAPGATVAIEGVALRTWKVGLEGGTIAMDNADRFSGTITTSPEHPDIAVRLTHPTLGTHYYLRRAAGSK